MRNFISENRLYLICFLGYALIGATLLFSISQGDLILFASENRSNLTNYLFIYGTKLGEEAVYILLFICFLFKKVRLAIAVGAVGLITMLMSYVSKSFFLHDRPALYFRKLKMLEEINLVEGVELHTGATSFPSGHTMSAFALFSLLAFMLPRGKKNWSIMLFLVAVLIALSRVYLVQHFLKDIYLGAWMGLAISILVYFLFIRRSKNADPNYWLNKPIFQWKSGLLNRDQQKPGA